MTTTALDPGTRTSRGFDLVRAEWIKFCSLRTTWFMVAIAVVTAVGVGALAANSDVHDATAAAAGAGAAQRGGVDPLADSFIGFLVSQLLFASIGALSVTGEYSSGLIRATMAAAPARVAVLAAKAAVVAGFAVVAGGLTALAAFGTGQAILARDHLDLPLTDPAAVRGVLAATAYLASAALIGLGLGVLLRHAASTVAALVALLFLAPELLHGSSAWLRVLTNALPGTAIRRLASLHVWAGAPSVPHAFLVVAAYPAVLLAVAAAVLRRRDV